MAKKKKKRGQQGVVSWATSIIALSMALGNVAARAVEAGGDWQTWVNFMIKDYGGFDTATNTFAIGNAARGYVPIVAGIAFKKLTGALIKSCKVQSIIPKLG